MEQAKRLARIKPSATLAINAKAQELKAQGKKIVSLAVGEPDFPTPVHVGEAAIQAVRDGFTRYTPVPGIPELREAAAGYYNRFYAISPTKENIIVTNGGKQALYNLLVATVNPGDEVLVPAPYWVSYPDMVALADGETVVVPTTPEEGFLVTPEILDKHLTPRTRMLILNTPSNPTGRHYSQERLDAIAAWAVEKNIFILADEVYDQLVYAPEKPASFSAWFEKHPENFAIVGALSKTFAMTGWRLGFCLAEAGLVKAMSKIQSQSTSNVCSIAQKAALAAFNGPWDIVDEMRAAFARRRDLLMKELSTWEGVNCPMPQGAFYAFPDVSACYGGDIPDSTALCAKILEETEVALVPGSAFGDDNCVRISYAVEDEVLLAALKKIGAVIAG